MSSEFLFAAVAKLAAELDSLYTGKASDRRDLLDFMDVNNWFGVTAIMQNITAFDIEIFTKPLMLWLSAYKKPGREKIRLMLEHFRGMYPITCRLYRDFVILHGIEDKASAWKLLDYILSEINREITDYNEHDLDGLVKGLNAEGSLSSARLFADFLRTTKHNDGPLTKWAYAFDSRDAPERVNDAYPFHDFALMAYYIFNEEIWAEQRLIEKAVQTKAYADLWLFAAFHFICALRTTDLKRLPAPLLPCDGETVLKRITEGTFSEREASAIVDEMIIRLQLKPIKPSKTSAFENVSTIKLFIPESLKAPLGMIIAVSLAHHPEIKPGEGFVFPVPYSLPKIKQFFGAQFAAALGDKGLASRRCNKSYLQGIDIAASVGDTIGRPKGYMLAALARSHKSGIGSLAKMTDVYLKDANFSGYTPEFIIREMFERGVFSFIPTILLEMYTGNKYKTLSVRTQTRLIGEIGLEAHQIEQIFAAADYAFEKSMQTVNTVLRDSSHIKENVFSLLQNIASGNAPGRQEECLCLMTATGLRCPYSDRNTCIGCGYEIYTKATIHILMKEYVQLSGLKKSAEQADAQRYEQMLKQAVLPAVSEMLTAMECLYPGEDMTEILNIVERGILSVDGNVGINGRSIRSMDDCTRN